MPREPFTAAHQPCIDGSHRGIMQLIKTYDWHFCADGSPRGYIQAQHLRELWFHTGTACNLACPFCLEGSRPGDDRLGLMTLKDCAPYIEEAVHLGVERFSFTGGEPFVARQLPAMLDRALSHAPTLVLSNGSRALLQRLDQIAPLVAKPHPLSFRISIDYPHRERHEAGRGPGTFDQALESLRRLQQLGFRISVARQQSSPDEDASAVDAGFRELFVARGLPADLPIIWFPDFAAPFSHREHPEITEHCMTAYQTAATRERFMCAFSRMVVKHNDSMRVYACTLVDDDPQYDLGETLARSLRPKIMLRHHRCFSCFKHGSSCSEI
jgi:sulfatase maturation enzyme AslB (radical SAM superfamily)